MTKRVLDFDPMTGLLEFHSYDPVTDTTVIESVQDVTPILERNKTLQRQDDGGWSPSRDLRRAAAIQNLETTQRNLAAAALPLAA